MEEFVDAMQEQALAIVEKFMPSLFGLPKSKRILDMLSGDELKHLKAQQVKNLISLAAPRLDAREHEKMALRVGGIHAIVGLEREELAHSRSMLVEAVYDLLGHRVDSKSLVNYSRRLSRDLAYQFKAYQNMVDAQQKVLLQIMKMTWTVQSYADFIRKTTDILSSHDEIPVCAISRPDESGFFRFEAVAGHKASDAVLNMLLSPGQQPVVHADHAFGHGPVSLAWRGGKIERIINLLTYSRGLPHHSQALEAGLRSCAAIPLRMPDRPALAVLLLFSAFPGGFIGRHQESFIGLLQTILGSAISRLRDRDEGGRIISVSTRQHIAALLRSEALQIYYQPLLDSRTGGVGKVEALARLHDGDRMLNPADFLSALSSDDFLELFERGLDRALSDRECWLAHGTDLGVSVNLPSAALSDIRYFEAARKALGLHACPADRLTLEVLEDESISLSEGQAMLSAFKSLGVILAQDDLGSGHSGLVRLRKLPFDWIKIDRGIINISDGGEDALKMLRFVYQLTRLGHSLGKSVVAEGVETLEMLRAMVILGVDSVQGYVLAQPMPFGDVLPWMGGWRSAGRDEVQAARGRLPCLAELTLWEERLSLDMKTPGLGGKLSDAQKSAVDAALAEGTDSAAFKAVYSRLVEAILAGQCR